MDIITSHHLILIDKIVKHGTMVAAAEEMNLTQSALSHQLKDLEHKLGTKVLSKRGKNFKLTETGKCIWESSQKILPELNRLHKEILALNEAEINQLRLCTGCYTSYHWFPSVLKQISEAKINIKTQIIAKYTNNPVQALLENKLDLAITSEEVINPLIISQKLFVDDLVAVLSKDHPFANDKEIISIQDFQHFNFIHYDAGDQDSFFINEYLTPNNIKPKKITKIAFTDLIFDMINANLGVAVLSSWYVHPYINNEKFKIMRLDKSVKQRTWYANYFPSKRLIIEPFCQYLKSAMIPIYNNKNNETME